MLPLMTVLQDLIRAAVKRLDGEGIDDPALDARLLIAHALHTSRTGLITQSERELTMAEIIKIEGYIARRQSHEPVARIMGQREFWGLPFTLNEATLEPRPDSETLIETALKTTPAPAQGASFSLLDLGTGTGCLLLSLLAQWPAATGLGVDINPRAVQQAGENARDLELDARATFKESDWLAEVTGKFDLIISNPPYIPSHEIISLQPEVKNFDPRTALDGGGDGMAPYVHLIPLLPRYLKEHGRVIFEVGQGQAENVAALLNKNGFINLSIIKDLGGIQRCVTATLV